MNPFTAAPLAEYKLLPINTLGVSTNKILVFFMLKKLLNILFKALACNKDVVLSILIFDNRLFDVPEDLKSLDPFLA